MEMVFLKKKLMARFGLAGRYFVKQNIDYEYQSYIYRADKLRDSFLRKFFLQAVNCARADSYEFYTAMRKVEIGAVLEYPSKIPAVYRWLCVFYISLFLSENKNDVDAAAIRAAIPLLFNFHETEEKWIDGFISCAGQSDTEFELSFSRFFMEGILNFKNNNPVTIAFMCNFFYNSYNSFISSFVNFVSLQNADNRERTRFAKPAAATLAKLR